MTEAKWQGKVRELATLYGWAIYHTHRSDRSDKGWPDLVLCKPPRLVIVELKTDDRKSKVTPEQREWLERLAACGVEVGVWRPSSLAEVIRVLGPRKQPAKLPETFRQ